MHYRTLGRTGIQVSPYALGAMNFGAMSNADQDDAVRIIHRAFDVGINLIDTADVYSRGESEEIVGQALRGPPGTDVGQLQMAYNPPSVVKPTLRRRPLEQRTAA
jgi:aryl-alcohol dehydrogenase-like predicted oxidoreductase